MAFAPLKKEKRRVFMVHGPPGCGKTHMLGTAVRGTDDRLAILDCKGGTNTIGDLAGKMLSDKSPQVVVARNMNKFSDVWKNVSIAEKWVAENKVQWIAVDNISDMGAMFMREIRSVVYTTTDGKVQVPRKKQLQDYQICQQWMQDIMNWLVRLPTNLVFTAWTKFTDEQAVPRNESVGISDLISGDCEHVFYLKKSMDSDSEGGGVVVDDAVPAATKRVLITDSHEYMARSRGGHLPAAMDPDFQKVIEILSENGL